MTSVSSTPTRGKMVPNPANYVILSPHHLTSTNTLHAAAAATAISSPPPPLAPAAMTMMSPPSSTTTATTTTTILNDNILLTSKKGKSTKPKRPGAYSTANMRPSSVARRNARERNRVRQVNNGFTALRDHLPPVPKDESNAAPSPAPAPAPTSTAASRKRDDKISKVETLKRAVEYIRSLQALLDQHDALCSPGATSTSGSVPGGSLQQVSSTTSSVSSTSSSSGAASMTTISGSPPPHHHQPHHPHHAGLGSYYLSPAGSDSSSLATPGGNGGVCWSQEQQPMTPGGNGHHFQQHQLFAQQAMGTLQHQQVHGHLDHQQFLYHHHHHAQSAMFVHHQQPMSNNSSMSAASSLSPGGFSEAGSPAPSMMSSDGSSPARPTSTSASTAGVLVKLETQEPHFGHHPGFHQEIQQLDASYVSSAAEYEDLTPLSPDDEELLDAIAWWQQN